MRAILTGFAIGTLALLLSACHGGDPGSATMVPQTQDSAARSAQAQAASEASARYWFTSCVGCGIRMQNTTAQVNVYSRSGSLLKQFSFANTPGQGVPLALTSLDQNHVYVTIDQYHENYIADIDTMTYGVRYYRLPISDQQTVSGLFNNSDGSRLYAVTSAGLYAINTQTRTYAGSLNANLAFPAISANAQTIFGVSGGELTAVNVLNFTQRHFARDPGTLGLAASTFYLYGGSTQGVNVYDLSTYAHVKTILSGLYERVLTDPAEERLYAAFNGPTEQDLTVVDTQSNQTVTTIHNFSQGPYLDSVTHSIYLSDTSGDFCEYLLPNYTQTCLFTVNSGNAQNVAITH